MLFRASFSLLAASLPAALAWGPDGHAVVAHIGDTRMSASARKAVDDIMGEGVRMADWAAWPDTILHGPDRDQWKWSSGLHYADTISDGKCHFEYARDCKDDYCVVGAISNYTTQIGDFSLPNEQRKIALQFLMHFMGDIHQPLHVGQSGDLGGNKIKVSLGFADQKDAKIHKVWDEKIIDQYEETLYNGDYVQQDFDYSTPVAERTEFWSVTYDAITKEIESGEFADEVDSWVEECKSMGWDACLNTFAQESATLACNQAYKNVDNSELVSGDTVSMEYYNSRSKSVVKQLAKGGVRLAYILDASLGATTTTTAPTTTATTTIAPTTTTTTPATPSGSHAITAGVAVILGSLALVL